METEITTGNTGVEGQVNTPTDTSAAPTPIELKDDSFVKIPGMEKPVKYGEHYRGLQGQLTKASQRAAELERRYAEAQARLEERERALQRTSQPQQTPQNPALGLVDKLRELPYLTGAEAAEAIQSVIGQVGQFGTELQRRDLALQVLYHQLKATRDMVNNLQSNHTNSAFENKISRWVGELGLPPEAKELAQEIYLAYEGDDLDSEFPNILRNRWDQLMSIARATEKARVDNARRLPFVPGKGGQGVPSKPLQDKLAKASPAQVADELWDAMQSLPE